MFDNPNIKKWFMNYWIYIIIYIFFFYVSFTSPRLGDDWEFKFWYQNGFLSNLFSMIRSVYYYSGRIFGNFFVNFFAFYTNLWVLISPLIFTLIIYYSLRYFSLEKNPYAILINFLLTLSVSDGIRLQTFTYLTGNIAYIPLILLLFIQFGNLISEKPKEYFGINDNKTIKTIFIFSLSIIIGLWMENATIGFLSSNFIILIFAFLNQKSKKNIITSLVGITFSSLIMFGNPAHSQRMSNYSDPTLSYLDQININFPILIQQLILDNVDIFIFCFLIIFFDHVSRSGVKMN